MTTYGTSLPPGGSGRMSMAEIRARIEGPKDKALTLQTTISAALKNFDIDVLRAYLVTIESHGPNGPQPRTTEFHQVLQEIIVPVIGINPTSIVYESILPTIMTTFVALLRKEIGSRESTQGSESIIDPRVIERVAGRKGFEVITGHLRDTQALSEKGFSYAGYSELMKAFEKILKKICLIYHRQEYVDTFGETPINAKMEDMVKFMRKLSWNERQYVKPIDELNKFANDDKHSMNSRGNLLNIEAIDYNGIFSFILDWIDAHVS